MTFIRRSEVPVYLQTGAFYEALEANDEEFEVPEGCVKPDNNIESYEGLRQLLSSLRFWAVLEVPGGILDFLLKHGEIAQIDTLLADFPEFEVYLNKIMRLKTGNPDDMTRMAIELSLGTRVLRFLHEDMGCVLDPRCWIAAAHRNDVASMVYLEAQVVPEDKDNVVCAAASFGSIEALIYARTQGWEVVDRAVLHAAANGHLGCVQYLHEVCGIIPSSRSTVMAADSGNLALIRYLVEKGCPWDPEVCATFADNGNLEGLIFARENGCPWNEFTCRCAAEMGHLSCLKYAHQQGCPWDARTCHAAARGGHLCCLKYAHERGCPWNALTVLEAAHGSYFDCVTYACKHGCPVDGDLIESALGHGAWESAWWALKRGAVSKDTVALVIFFCIAIIWIYYKIYKAGNAPWPWGTTMFGIVALVWFAMEVFEPLLTQRFMSTGQLELVRNGLSIAAAVFSCRLFVEVMDAAYQESLGRL